MRADFYAAPLAQVHHEGHGDLARAAAATLLAALGERCPIGQVVDLGCGSGILARIVSDAGAEVLGVDVSPAMIELARAHAPAARLVCASIFDVDLPPATAVTAVGEILSYAVDPRAGLAGLTTLTARVRAALAPGGVFLLDLATRGRAPAPGTLYVRDEAEWALFSRAVELDGGALLERRITLFQRTGDSTLWSRSDEVHRLALYDEGAAIAAITSAGFAVERLAGFGEFTIPRGWAPLLARAV